MKKLLSVLICVAFVLTMTACAKNDLPSVSIPTDEELSGLIGEYEEESRSSENSETGSSESTSEITENSASSSEGSSSDENGLKPQISSGNSSEGSSAESEEEHSITTVVSPFLVSESVIEEGKKNGNPPDPRPTELICTISVSCKTAIDTGVNKNSGFTHLPSDGWILSPTTVSYSKGDTVFDVLAKALQDGGIQMEYSGMGGLQYIEGIDNLYEFDGGRWSGWMYCVNSWYPNFGCGQYTVDPGDVIEWNYTCDLGDDLGQSWMG